MNDHKIKSIVDLTKFRTAPSLESNQSRELFKELLVNINNADWFTVGIMASSTKIAIDVIREIENCFKWPEMNIVVKPNNDGPVFLKANQSTGDIYIRLEDGLGEGVLLSCQHNDNTKDSITLGPFPLDFFKV